MVIYLLTPFGYNYRGKVVYNRITNIQLSEDQVYKLFYQLSQNKSFIGLIYFPEKKILITYFLPSLQWQIFLLTGLASFLGGIALDSWLKSSSSSGTGYFTPENPPGLPNLSFTDILKIGLISIIASFVVYIGVNAYVSIKKGEYMKEVYAPITKELLPATKEAVGGLYKVITSRS